MRWPTVLTTILIVLLSGACILQGVKLNRLERAVTAQATQIEVLHHTAVSQDEVLDVMQVIAKHMNKLSDRVKNLEQDDVERHRG